MMRKNHICIQKRLLAVLLVCALIFGILPSRTVSAQQDLSGNEFGLSNPVVDNGVTTWDCIYFGSYWQNDTNGDGYADNSDDRQPIKWRVLSVNGDDVFLLSDRNLSRQVYNSLSDEKGVKWETSTIRSWLNGYSAEANICGQDYTDDNFLDAAFDEFEQAAIKDTLVVNTDNSPVFPDNGRDTTDKVYLLSVPEIMKAAYGFVSTWNKSKPRKAKNTAYIDAGESEGDWWLRTIGEVSSFGDKACHIDGEGRLWQVNEESYLSDLSHTVRPALHLNLAALDSTSNLIWSYAGKITSDGKEIGPEAEIKVTEVRLSDTDKTLKIGEKYQIEATVLPANAADKTLTYKSSDDSVLSVSDDGEAEAKEAGTAIVTVTSANGKLAQLQVTVEEEPEIPGDVPGNEFGLSNPVVDNGVTTWDCIYFGSYWQNNSDDKQPIKWRVLSVDGDDVFLLSDRNLSRQVYNSLSDEKGVKWETSTIRSWLNGYNGEANICGRDYTDDNFLDDAFDEVEQAAIKDTLVVNTDNSSAFPDNGRDTTDKVYLLSVPEIMKESYGFVSTWNKSKPREAKNTAYIDAGESKGNWWLRTICEASSFGDKACHIDGEGRLWRASGASYLSDLGHTVRPALHLNLAALDSTSNLIWSYAGKITSDGKEIEPGAEITVTEVSLSDTDKTLKIGEKYRIEATVLPANAADKTLTYKSSDESVLSVSTDGEVEAKKAGTAIVMVMSANGKLAQLQVTVEEEPEIPGDVQSSVGVIEIKLSDTGKMLKIGEKYQVKATVLPLYATDKTLTYKSSDDSVASVSAVGEVEAKKAGTAIVTVMSANGRIAKMQVTVGEEVEEPEEPRIPGSFESPVEVTEVKISDTGKTLKIGEKYRIGAIVLPLNATDKTLTYKSSDDSVASVSAVGEVEAKRAGTAIVTVMSANGKMAQLQVTVEEMEKKIEVQKVLVSANKMTVGVGEKVQLEAAVYPGDAFNKALTYKASNNKVKVNKQGVLTAHKTGSCKITISSSNNKSVVVKVTVKKKPTEISLNAKKKTLKVGKKFQIKAKLPNGTASYKIAYTSNKESVAVVSRTGKVTAMKKGNAIITAETYNGKKAILKLHVK